MTHAIEHEQARPVVVGLDGSANAAAAVRWAAGEAALRDLPLNLVHALHLPVGAALPLEPPDYAERAREQGRKLLDAAKAEVRAQFPDLTVHTELSDLPAARTLAALSVQAGVVVTGTRGHGGFAGMLLGSVSRKLAAHAHCPLVVVRGEGPRKLDEVVVGVEPGEPEGAIRYAFTAARRYGAALRAVRAWYPRSTYSGPTGTYFADFEEVREQEAAAVEELLAPLRTEFPDVTVQVTAERGNPVPVLADCARAARLLVVGTHRHRGPLAVGAGYVVEGLLAHSPTPVAVVPVQ